MTPAGRLGAVIREPEVLERSQVVDPGLLIESATEEVHAARRRHRREVVERTRLRRLVERVDSAIELCEETHLQGIKEVPPDVAERAHKVFVFARGAVRKTGDVDAMSTVGDALARRQVKITEVMDILWTIQEVVFDLMLPWRTQLPEDVEPEGDEASLGGFLERVPPPPLDGTEPARYGVGLRSSLGHALKCAPSLRCSPPCLALASVPSTSALRRRAVDL